MRLEPGFLRDLRLDLASLAPEVVDALERPGSMGTQKLLSCVANPLGLGAALGDLDQHPTEGDIGELLAPDDEVGNQAIARGEVGFVILASDSENKALWRLPGIGISLLASKVLQAHGPTFVLASPQNARTIHEHLASMTPIPPGAVVEGFETCCLTVDHRVLFVSPGQPIRCSTGSGDLGPALVNDGVLDSFPGVNHLFIVDVANGLAGFDPALVGCHIRKGATVTCEVVKRMQSEAGYVPAWRSNCLQLVGSGDLPDADWLHTTTMVIDREALLAPVEWCWHRVRKQRGSQIVVQHERSLTQLTSLFCTSFVAVPRESGLSRVESEADLVSLGERLDGNVLR